MLISVTARAARVTLAAVAVTFASVAPPAYSADAPTLAIVVHGGAGVINRAEMTSEREAQYRAGLEEARDAGYAVLERGGSSVDAVTAAVRVLEDNPLFNAGKGAVLNRDGIAELDSSIMDGKTLRAGAIAGVKHVKNPIELARAVMEKSPHVMLAGEGAEEFALEQELTMVPNSYFRTEARVKQLERAQKQPPHPETTRGTVGAVARDRNGNLAAATSTGGMTNKRPGRIGDSPLIGAGTYANNASCAVSATGDGEYFIRSVVAHDICALVQYKRVTLEAAAREVIHEKIEGLKATGGVIALDRDGHIVMDFNSGGMFRAARDSDGRRDVAIYKDR
jgi:L-asparaginase / beta-aspartyl-peptidase